MLSIGNQDNLANISDTGVAPKRRIQSATEARNIFAALYRSYERRHRKNALVKGLVDGNPPWSDKTRDAQRYKANFNNGEAYAYLETAITALYDIYSEPETFATVYVESADPQAPVWSDSITKNFDWLQRQDDAMDFNHQQSIHETVLYGTGPQIFPNRLDWRSRAVQNLNLYVNDETPANVSDWPLCQFTWNLDVGDVWNFISDEEFARSQGWNVQAVKDAIIACKPGTWGTEWNNWERWQQHLRNNDIWLSSQCRKCRLVQTLYKEFAIDGAQPKITELWVSRDLQETDDFLMEKEGSYDDMREAVYAGYYDRGDGTHQSIKGLGVKMFQLLTTKMRLQLAAVDAAFASSTVFLSSNAPAGRNTVSNIQFGALTVLPNGMQIQQANLQGVLEPAMAMSQDMSRTLDQNLSQYRQRMEKQAGNPVTKFEKQVEVAQAATLGKSQIARNYFQLDELYTEKFRRATNKDIPKGTNNKWLKLALDFQKKCRDDGVPPKALEYCCVKATRIAGQGSPFMREQSLNQIYATLFPNLPPDGQERLIRDMISASVGPNLTQRYWTKDEPSLRMQDQVWEAQIEDGILYDGGQVNITPQQNDSIHLQEHFKWLMQGVQSLQSGGDLHEVFNSLVAGRAHVAEHLQRLAQNPAMKQQFDQFKQLFEQLSQAIDHAQAVLEQQGKQQAEKQQQLQAAQGQADAQTLLAQSKIQNDQAKTQNQLQIKEAKAAQDMRLKEAKTQQDLGIKQISTGQQLSIDQLKAHQDATTKAIQNAGLIAQQRIANEKPLA